MSEKALHEFVENTIRLEMYKNVDAMYSSMKTFMTVLINFGFDRVWVETEAIEVFTLKLQEELHRSIEDEYAKR